MTHAAKKTKPASSPKREALTKRMVFNRICTLWLKTKKKEGEQVTQYDWGYRDGMFAARNLFRDAKPQE